MRIIRKTYDWMGSKVYSKYSDFWLSALFFIEAVFFIPVDPILILFCVHNNKKSIKYATIATISSVAGGVFGYTIGSLMWQSIGIKLVSWFISPQAFNTAIYKYKLYQNWAVLIAGFTPLPYKAITLSAGFCRLPIIPFIIFSFIARGARFFLISIAIRIWGPQIKYFIDRYFNQLVILFTIVLIASFWLLK
ncbi:DedA family protein [Candidatus Dependentiae bacterium]|nr:DedA family protein [Candidatus Dependentiae bacterium]